MSQYRLHDFIKFFMYYCKQQILSVAQNFTVHWFLSECRENFCSFVNLQCVFEPLLKLIGKTFAFYQKSAKTVKVLYRVPAYWVYCSVTQIL